MSLWLPKQIYMYWVYEIPRLYPIKQFYNENDRQWRSDLHNLFLECIVCTTSLCSYLMKIAYIELWDFEYMYNYNSQLFLYLFSF